MAVKACMYCGSDDISRKQLFEGPVVYTHNAMDSIYCAACGKSGVPMLFDTEDERESFERELAKEE